MTEPLNLLLVSLDTLRADVAYGAGLPGIADLRARGTSFLNTVASAPAYYREELHMPDGEPSRLSPWKSLRIDNRRKVRIDVSSESLGIYDLDADPHERHPTVFGSPVF